MKLTFKFTKARTYQVHSATYGYLGIVEETGDGWYFYPRGQETGYAPGIKPTRDDAAHELLDLVRASLSALRAELEGQ